MVPPVSAQPVHYAAGVAENLFLCPFLPLPRMCGLWVAGIVKKLEANRVNNCGATLRATSAALSILTFVYVLPLKSVSVMSTRHGTPRHKLREPLRPPSRRQLLTVQSSQPQRGPANPRLQWACLVLQCIEICYNKTQKTNG